MHLLEWSAADTCAWAGAQWYVLAEIQGWGRADGHHGSLRWANYPVPASSICAIWVPMCMLKWDMFDICFWRQSQLLRLSGQRDPSRCLWWNTTAWVDFGNIAVPTDMPAHCCADSHQDTSPSPLHAGAHRCAPGDQVQPIGQLGCAVLDQWALRDPTLAGAPIGEALHRHHWIGPTRARCQTRKPRASPQIPGLWSSPRCTQQSGDPALAERAYGWGTAQASSGQVPGRG